MYWITCIRKIWFGFKLKENTVFVDEGTSGILVKGNQGSQQVKMPRLFVYDQTFCYTSSQTKRKVIQRSHVEASKCEYACFLLHVFYCMFSIACFIACFLLHVFFCMFSLACLLHKCYMLFLTPQINGVFRSLKNPHIFCHVRDRFIRQHTKMHGLWSVRKITTLCKCHSEGLEMLAEIPEIPKW